MADARERLHTNPLRHRLLYEYTVAPASPSQVARRLGQPLNLVSYHTRVLVQQGVLELVRTEQRRGGTAHVYRSTVATIIEDDGWARLPIPVRRMLARAVLATVSDTSREAMLAGGFDAATAHISRWPMQLDEHDRREVARVLRRLLDELAAIQAASDLRADGPRHSVEVVLLGFLTGA